MELRIKPTSVRTFGTRAVLNTDIGILEGSEISMHGFFACSASYTLLNVSVQNCKCLKTLFKLPANAVSTKGLPLKFLRQCQ